MGYVLSFVPLMFVFITEIGLLKILYCTSLENNFSGCSLLHVDADERPGGDILNHA